MFTELNSNLYLKLRLPPPPQVLIGNCEIRIQSAVVEFVFIF